jgi:hypothetical protein
MLDFDSVREGKVTYSELVAGLTHDDLRDLTNEMIDGFIDQISECIDADVTFEPVDPEADDPWAVEGEEDMAWILGHVIVHTTASAEEAAALAAELARGVEFHGRSRYETPWRTVTTTAQCRQRLEESRRMRLASLDMWPDEPHLDNTYIPWEGAPPANAVARFIMGLKHADDHVGQVADIVRQAKAARA